MLTDDYKEQIRQYRKENPEWGSTAAKRHADPIARYANSKPFVEDILDFGCGTGTLVDALQDLTNMVEVFGYDPSSERPEFSETLDSAQKFSLVVSTDVLEHIEPAELDATLQQIRDTATCAQYHHIDCNLTAKFLPDGRNLHLSVYPPEWWMSKLEVDGWKIVDSSIHRKLRRGDQKQSVTIVLEKGA
jgi:2-polyprenyl-3-methyl-5-hydroxy-6-metoxy-1,4-benzoquinol methylase